MFGNLKVILRLFGYNTNKKGLNVLSLFDGLSGARIALDKAGIEVDIKTKYNGKYTLLGD